MQATLLFGCVGWMSVLFSGWWPLDRLQLTAVLGVLDKRFRNEGLKVYMV